MKKNATENTSRIVLKGIVAVEVVLLFLFVLLLIMPSIKYAYAVVGINNVTVTTYLNVGNVFPEVTSIRFVNSSAITLIPNATRPVVIEAIVRDYNGEGDINNTNLTFFNTATSSFGAISDNNRNYLNSSCNIDTAYGDIYEVNVTCIVDVYYYSEPGNWNATVIARDNSSLTGTNTTNLTINSLLALGLPDSINYGTVNATQVSDEQVANVTNFGNVMMNLSVKGYAQYSGDGLAMNCSLGSLKNISIEHEKYNVTLSNAGYKTLSQAGVNYTNLSSSNVVHGLNLPYRQYDSAPYTDDTNSTYWRIYVPIGVAGSCQGNLVFGAVQTAES